jgi:hypothetical protein
MATPAAVLNETVRSRRAADAATAQEGGVRAGAVNDAEVRRQHRSAGRDPRRPPEGEVPALRICDGGASTRGLPARREQEGADPRPEICDGLPARSPADGGAGRDPRRPPCAKSGGRRRG